MKMMVSTAATGTVKSTWCSLSELMQKVGVVRSILPSTTPLTEQISNIDYLSIFIYKLTCIRIRRKGIIKVEATIVRLDCKIQPLSSSPESGHSGQLMDHVDPEACPLPGHIVPLRPGPVLGLGHPHPQHRDTGCDGAVKQVCR